MLLVDLFVPGVPRTKGSLDLRNRKAGTLAGDPREVQWAAIVKRALIEDRSAGGHAPIDGPVGVDLVFLMPTESVIVQGPGAGDLDKLVRSVLDAITQAKVWGDDVQVVEMRVAKVDLSAPGQPGVIIRIDAHGPVDWYWRLGGLVAEWIRRHFPAAWR